jgi:hypothetical protein
MEAIMLKELVTVESAPEPMPSAPAKAVPRVYRSMPQKEQSIELQRARQLEIDPARSGTATPGDQIGDLEMSHAPSPTITADGVEVEVLPSIWDPYMNRFRFLSTCLMNFQNGLNDSAPGALIPYMETYVGIN